MPNPSPAGMSIEDFKAVYQGKNLARPTRYTVQIEPIQGLNGQYPIFQPETVTLPSRSLSFAREHFHGPPRKVPIGRLYDNSLIMTFPLDEAQTERTFFEWWMDNLIMPDTDSANGGANNMRGNVFHSSVIVTTLDYEGNYMSNYRFLECFPQTILPIQYGFGMFNDYARMQVQFHARYYIYESKPSNYTTPL